MHRLAPSAIRAASLALAVSLASQARGDVLVVDVDDPAAHATVQSAVDAASDGDTVVVRAPRDPLYRYLGFTIDDKALTVRGEGRPYLLTGPVAVVDLALGDEVVLDGLSMNLETIPEIGQGYPFSSSLEVTDTSGPGLLVVSSQGAVRVQDCHMQGSAGDRMWAGLQLALAYDVVLVDCTVYGNASAEYATPSGASAQLAASRLAAYGTYFEGGLGRTALSDGGVGLLLAQRSVAWLGACTVHGGEGAGTYCHVYPCHSDSGDGGDGLVVTTGSVCFESGCELVGGPGGVLDEGTVGHAFGLPGVDGEAVVGVVHSDASTHVECDVAATRLTSGAAARLTIVGQPGEAARVAVARGGGFRFFGLARGAMGVSDFVDPAGFVSLGVLPASGVLVADVALPDAASGATSESLFLQVALDDAGSFRLSAPIAVSVDGADVPSSHARRVVRVDPTAAPDGDGRTWASAYATLEDGLRALPWTPDEGEVELWLREGTHRPLREEGSLVGHRCRIIGGFDGTETSANEADPVLHPTILDADRLGDGSTNPHHLENADVILEYGSEFLRLASHGSTCEGLTLRNTHTLGRSGAIVVHGDTTVRQCRFEENLVPAILHYDGRLRVDRTRFVEQRTNYYASSIQSEYQPYMIPGTSGSLEVVSCEFVGNVSSQSATIRVKRRDSVRVVGSTFHGNLAQHQAFGAQGPGALTLTDTPAVDLIGSIFTDNSLYGGWDPGPTLQIGTRDSQLSLTFSCAPDLDPAWQNGGNVAAFPQYVDGNGPNGIVGDADDDLRLAPVSPCIDAGDSLAFGPTDVLDVAGRPRRADDPAVGDTGSGGAPVADIGAHER
ncbi:MAG: hypothetical protein AAGB93_13775 [Planctomycetota bacterium]